MTVSKCVARSPLSLYSAPNATFSLQVIATTNQIDILDPALLRSGRLDRKIEFPLPNESTRARILEINSRKMTLEGNVNFEELGAASAMGNLWVNPYPWEILPAPMGKNSHGSLVGAG